MTLAQAVQGVPVIVESVLGFENPAERNIALRLMEMGITPGVEITLIGAAPLGDPLEFELRGYRLSLRRLEARLVAVRKAEV